MGGGVMEMMEGVIREGVIKVVQRAVIHRIQTKVMLQTMRTKCV